MCPPAAGRAYSPGIEPWSLNAGDESCIAAASVCEGLIVIKTVAAKKMTVAIPII
ncbi:hypothetical protein SBDP1_1570003 [Syntrophobacter sp. SbD1]|nr:hypothetical protein SBDP1_1570003 [Syntrophobacter sp. SbD1]